MVVVVVVVLGVVLEKFEAGRGRETFLAKPVARSGGLEWVLAREKAEPEQTGQNTRHGANPEVQRHKGRDRWALTDQADGGVGVRRVRTAK
jgi:hypothetical protein